MMNFFLPFKGVFCRVQPIAFDGTLSFLELLNKLQYHMNDIIDNLNDLETALNEFEQYVETALDGKQDVLTWDETPTAGSTNPVYSRGIKTYVDDGLAGKQDTLTFDSVPTDGSTNPVESNGIYDALAGKQDSLTFDTTPTANSTNPVESKGIKLYVDNALSGKQDILSWDSVPTENSLHPVTSGGIKTYVDGHLPLKLTGNLDLGTNAFTPDTGVTFANILAAFDTDDRDVWLEAQIYNSGVITRSRKTFFRLAACSATAIAFSVNDPISGDNMTLTVSDGNVWTFTATH